MPFPTKDFPSAADIERVVKDAEYFNLYNSEMSDPKGETERGRFRLKEFFENDREKAKILDIALNVAPLVVDCATDFLFGKPVRIEVDDTADEDAKNKVAAIVTRNSLHSKLEDSAALFQSIGHAHFKLYANEKREAVIEEVPYDYWFPNWANVPLGQEPSNVRIVVYLTSVEDGKEEKYVYVEDYFMQGTAKVAKSLWKDKNKQISDQVSLKTLNIAVSKDAQPLEKQPLTMVEDTKLSRIPLVSLNVRKTAKDKYGQSVYKKIKPLLYEVNDRLTQLSIQFLKHLNAKLQIPEGSVTRDKDGKVQNVNLEVLIARQGDPEAKYIVNENPLIEQSFIHIKNTLRQIAKLTQTPDMFLIEDEKGGVEAVSSLRARLMYFLKRVERYDQRYTEAIRSLMHIAMEIEGVADAEKVPLVITFDPALPKDWETDSRVWGAALSSGLASKETAVGSFQGIEGDELEEELGRIDEEEKKLAMTMLAAEPEDADPEDEE